MDDYAGPGVPTFGPPICHEPDCAIKEPHVVNDHARQTAPEGVSPRTVEPPANPYAGITNYPTPGDDEHGQPTPRSAEPTAALRYVRGDCECGCRDTITPSAAPPKDRQGSATFGDTTPSAAPDPRLVEAVENLPIMFVEDAESEARMAVVSRYAVLALLRPDVLPMLPSPEHIHEYVRRDGWWCSCGLQFCTDDPRPRLICAVCAKPKGVADIHAFDHGWEPVEDYLEPALATPAEPRPAPAGLDGLREALTAIRDMEPEAVPDLPAHEGCAECQRRSKAGWPPSGMCEDRYRQLSNRDRAYDQNTNAQQWRMRDIARAALARSDAPRPVPCDHRWVTMDGPTFCEKCGYVSGSSSESQP